jgi:hypothetical protein
MPPHDLLLDAADAIELGELLAFLDDWLDGNDSTLLAASLHRFVSTTGYDLSELRTDLACFTFLLGPHDGTQLFSPDKPRTTPGTHTPGARTGDDRWGQIT